MHTRPTEYPDHMMFPQYVSLLKSRAHELDAVEGKSGGGRSRYQSIHNSERDGKGGHGDRSSRDGHGRGRGRGGCGRGHDKKKVMPCIPEEIYKQLPTEVKKAIYEAKNAAEKSSEEKAPAQDHTVNQAETVVPSSISVTTEATGIMGAVTGGRSTASDIQQVLSATRGVATGSRGEYCVTDDGKVYVSMNTLSQYRTNIGGVSKPTI